MKFNNCLVASLVTISFQLVSCKHVDADRASGVKVAGGEKAGLYRVPGAVELLFASSDGTLLWKGGGTFVRNNKILTVGHVLAGIGNAGTPDKIFIRYGRGESAKVVQQPYNTKTTSIYQDYAASLVNGGFPDATVNVDWGMLTVDFEVDDKMVMAIADNGMAANDPVVIVGPSDSIMDVKGQVDGWSGMHVGYNVVHSVQKTSVDPATGKEFTLNALEVRAPLPATCGAACPVPGDSGSGAFNLNNELVGLVSKGVGITNGVLTTLYTNIHADPSHVGAWLVAQGVPFTPRGYRGTQPILAPGSKGDVNNLPVPDDITIDWFNRARGDDQGGSGRDTPDADTTPHSSSGEGPVSDHAAPSRSGR